MPTPSHPYEFKLIKAKEINVDKLYQRGKQNPIVKEITHNFDYHKVNCVKVVYRDGCYFAFDGQQTTTGLRTKFGDNYLVPCLVYYDVPSWVDEAILFEGTNAKKARKAVGVRDLWNSRLNRGDETATAIRKIVERHHMRLATATEGNKSASGKIQALEAVEYAFNLLGEEKFEDMITILDLTWNGAAESLTSPMIRGMALFVNAFYGEYKRNKLIEKLSKPKSLGMIIVGGSSGARRGPKKYAEEITGIYNNGLGDDSQSLLDIKKI